MTYRVPRVGGFNGGKTLAEQKLPNVRQRLVLRALNTWADERGPFTRREDLAKALKWSTGKLSNILSGKTPAGPEHILHLAITCDIPEAEWRALWTTAQAGAVGGDDTWWLTYSKETVGSDLAEYLATEAIATGMLSLDGMFIPGLLQDEPYARETIEAHGESTKPDDALVRERLNVRKRRQARLEDTAHPLTVHAIIAEAALWTHGDFMHDQLAHLAERATLPTVTLQVIAHERGIYPQFGRSYRVLSFDDGATQAVYTESLKSGLYIEGGEVAPYKLNHERLSRMALTPDESIERIESVRRQRARRSRK